MWFLLLVVYALGTLPATALAIRKDWDDQQFRAALWFWPIVLPYWLVKGWMAGPRYLVWLVKGLWRLR